MQVYIVPLKYCSIDLLTILLKQINFLSMQFAEDNSQFLTRNINHSFALRRNVRIRSSKLPPDFFVQRPSCRYIESPRVSRQIGVDLSNRTIRTPTFSCRKRQSRSEQVYAQGERKVETARPSLIKIENQMDLISAKRKQLGVIKRQSVEFSEYYGINTEDHLQLPKINKGFIKKL